MQRFENSLYVAGTGSTQARALARAIALRRANPFRLTANLVDALPPANPLNGMALTKDALDTALVRDARRVDACPVG